MSSFKHLEVFYSLVILCFFSIFIYFIISVALWLCVVFGYMDELYYGQVWAFSAFITWIVYIIPSR